jgi:CHAT domain
MNNKPIKILFLAANPVNTSQLRLGEEVRSIQEELERAKYRDRFELISKWAVQVNDLSQVLLEHKPQIVHFSGHGQGKPIVQTQQSSRQDTTHHSSAETVRDIGFEPEQSTSVYEGLVFEDDQGRAKLVSGEALAGLFQLFQNDVKCVVLNACYSEVQANAIHQHIDCVVGMNKAIGDQAAIEFATEFYKALATGYSFDFAYKFARNGLDLASIPESSTPVCKIRHGTDDPFAIAASTQNPQKDVVEPPAQPQGQSIGNVTTNGNDNPFAVTQASGNAVVSQKHSPQSITISGSNISGHVGQAGENLTQTQYQNQGKSTKQLTLAEVIQLITQIETLLRGSALPNDQKDKAMTHLESVKDEVASEEPDKQFAAKSLQKVTKLLKETNETVGVGQELWNKVAPILKQLLPWLGVGVHLFGL